MISYELKPFDAQEIRTTAQQTSTLADNRGYALKTIIIENGHNQQATFECWASANQDFSNSFMVGSSWDVSANANMYQTCDSYFPYMKIKVAYNTAPTVGSLTVHFIELTER